MRSRTRRLCRMRELKMAELQFEAPLATFEGDEWNEFHDFTTASDLENCNKSSTMSASKAPTADLDNFGETFSGSLEDLVNTFDEKITKCFCNYEENVEKFAPVQVRTQEEIMNDCQMWWTITGNFGNILPIDWSKSYARQLHEKSLNLLEKTEEDVSPDGDYDMAEEDPSEGEGEFEEDFDLEPDSPDLDLSDDEELQQAFDMHSLIISSLQQEPMFTADEVINEIEVMMEGDSPSPTNTPPGPDFFSTASTELLQFKEKQQTPGCNYEESLKNLSMSALNELYEELECTIKDYSETLIYELTLKDELDYEKELKNQFISLLLSVQKKRRETQADKKGKNNNFVKKPKSETSSTTPEVGTYLTTVIPYHAKPGPPTIEQLQIYIKILTAINEDSPQVPGLLTDYILKVLCPTT